VVIMHEGRILVEGSPREVIASHTSPQVIEVFEPPEDAEAGLAELESVASRAERLADRWLFYTNDGDALLSRVRSLPLDPSSVWLRGGTLEDVFLALTGRGLLE
jgi:lipooligosaccharide transport system ATP-binding protein